MRGLVDGRVDTGETTSERLSSRPMLFRNVAGRTVARCSATTEWRRECLSGRQSRRRLAMVGVSMAALPLSKRCARGTGWPGEWLWPQCLPRWSARLPTRGPAGVLSFAADWFAADHGSALEQADALRALSVERHRRLVPKVPSTHPTADERISPLPAVASGSSMGDQLR
jgi:hypothetical protein